MCVASCVILWLAPQVPYSQIYSGGRYVHYPALLLAATALVAALSLFPGSCGLSRDSKAALVAVRSFYDTANYSDRVFCDSVVLCDAVCGVSW